MQCGDVGGDIVVGGRQGELDENLTEYNKPFTPRDNRRVATVLSSIGDAQIRGPKTTHVIDKDILSLSAQPEADLETESMGKDHVLRFNFSRHKGIPTGCQQVPCVDL